MDDADGYDAELAVGDIEAVFVVVAPTGDAAVCAEPADVVVAARDGGELAVWCLGVSAPARDCAVGAYAAGVVNTDSHGGELAVGGR